MTQTLFLTVILKYLIILLNPFRSSRPELFWIKSVLKNFAKFSRKQLKEHLLAKIVSGWKPLTIFAKVSILDPWQGFEYTFEMHTQMHYTIMWNVFKSTDLQGKSELRYRPECLFFSSENWQKMLANNYSKKWRNVTLFRHNVCFVFCWQTY